jgi:hypothetical protein
MAEIEALQLIRQHSSGFLLSRAIHAVTDLGIPDVLGEASEPAELLAQKVGVHPDALHRILRLLAGHGIFRETASRLINRASCAPTIRNQCACLSAE